MPPAGTRSHCWQLCWIPRRLTQVGDRRERLGRLFFMSLTLARAPTAAAESTFAFQLAHGALEEDWQQELDAFFHGSVQHSRPWAIDGSLMPLATCQKRAPHSTASQPETVAWEAEDGVHLVRPPTSCANTTAPRALPCSATHLMRPPLRALLPARSGRCRHPSLQRGTRRPPRTCLCTLKVPASSPKAWSGTHTSALMRLWGGSLLACGCGGSTCQRRGRGLAWP